jgi:hypothetical protein
MAAMLGNNDRRVPEPLPGYRPEHPLGHNSMVYIIKSQLKWPASTLAFGRARRRLDLAEYDVLPAGAGR